MSGGGRIITPPEIIDDGNTVAWFDFASQYITKDGSNFVSQWDDRSGLDHHLLQAVGTNQPLWSTGGVLLDGVDNFMKCVAFTFNRPEKVYIVLKQVTWTVSDDLWDGNGTNSMLARNIDSTPDFGIFNGSFSAAESGLAVNTFGIVRALYDDGVNSSLEVNENGPVISDIGVVSNAAGFTLGSQGDGAALFSNIQVKEIILRKIEDTEPNDQLIYDYLAAKYSIS